MMMAAVSTISSLMGTSDTATQQSTAPDSTRDFAAMLSGSAQASTARSGPDRKAETAAPPRDDAAKSKDHKQGSSREQSSADDDAATLAMVGIQVPVSDASAGAMAANLAATAAANTASASSPADNASSNGNVAIGTALPATSMAPTQANGTNLAPAGEAGQMSAPVPIPSTLNAANDSGSPLLDALASASAAVEAATGVAGGASATSGNAVPVPADATDTASNVNGDTDASQRLAALPKSTLDVLFAGKAQMKAGQLGQVSVASTDVARADVPAMTVDTSAEAGADSAQPDTAMAAQAAPSAAVAAPLPGMPAASAVQQPASASQAQAASSPQQIAAAASPAPATVEVLAARGATKAAATDGKPAAPASRKASDKDDADAAVTALGDMSTSGDTSGTATVSAAPVMTAKADASVATSATADLAGQSLASSGADRQVDLAKSNAWLDGVARDISKTADSNGTLRFQVAPERLGSVQVEMTRGDDGSAVKLTASSEAARQVLDDAKPQLIVEAKAQGIRIADAQVNVGTETGSDRNRDHSGQQASQQQSSSSASGQGTAGQSSSGQSGNQARSQQNSPDYRLCNHWAATTVSDDAKTSATQAADGRYA